MKTAFTFVNSASVRAFCSNLSLGQTIISCEQAEARPIDSGLFRPLLGGKKLKARTPLLK